MSDWRLFVLETSRWTVQRCVLTGFRMWSCRVHPSEPTVLIEALSPHKRTVELDFRTGVPIATYPGVRLDYVGTEWICGAYEGEVIYFPRVRTADKRKEDGDVTGSAREPGLEDTEAGGSAVDSGSGSADFFGSGSAVDSGSGTADVSDSGSAVDSGSGSTDVFGSGSAVDSGSGTADVFGSGSAVDSGSGTADVSDSGSGSRALAVSAEPGPDLYLSFVAGTSDPWTERLPSPLLDRTACAETVVVPVGHIRGTGAPAERGWCVIGDDTLCCFRHSNTLEINVRTGKRTVREFAGLNKMMPSRGVTAPDGTAMLNDSLSHRLRCRVGRKQVEYQYFVGDNMVLPMTILASAQLFVVVRPYWAVEWLSASRFWAKSVHRHLDVGVRQMVMTLLLCGARIARDRRVPLPVLPTEMWLQILGNVDVSQCRMPPSRET